MFFFLKCLVEVWLLMFVVELILFEDLGSGFWFVWCKIKSFVEERSSGFIIYYFFFIDVE